MLADTPIPQTTDLDAKQAYDQGRFTRWRFTPLKLLLLSQRLRRRRH